MSAPKILSPQAILVSLAIHAIVVGVLFSVGVSKDDSLQESAKNPPAQAVAEKVSPEKVQETPSPDLEKKDEPQAEKKRETPEKEAPRKKPVEIRIEPEAPAAPKKPTAQKDSPLDKEAAEMPVEDKPVKTVPYVVKRGDTLTAIARDCGMTIPELAKLNGKTVKKLSDLKVGQRLKIPAKD